MGREEEAEEEEEEEEKRAKGPTATSLRRNATDSNKPMFGSKKSRV